MDIVRIGKTMLPAVVVLVAGLFGINFVYNNYLADGAASVITLEPAAGEETAPVSVEDGATVTTDTAATAPETTTETVVETETVTETSDECAAAHAAAAEAIGTDAEKDAAAAAKNCVDALNVKTAADAVIEQSTEEATEHLPVTEGDDAVETPAEDAVEE